MQRGERRMDPEIDKDGNKHWSNKEGQIHRDVDLPAIELRDGTKIWCINGLRHRDNGLPAVEWFDGGKEWFNNGRPHRIDGPAVIWHDGSTIWYMNGQMHRLDGPAVERTNGANGWYIFDEELTEEEFNKRIC